MKKIIAIIVSLMVAVGLFAGCESSSNSSSSGSNSSASGKVNISGSTSMEKLVKALGEAYNQKNSNVMVDIQLGGSSTGIKNATNGLSDIGMVSRDLKSSETGLDSHKIAIDGISVVVNSKNKVTDLTKEQILKIYTGEITNWKDVGGDNMGIVVVGREAGSGTRDGFESVIGIKENGKYNQELTETGAVKTTVSSTAGAIGYISSAYVDNTVSALKVNGIEATEQNIKNGTYPVARPFLMVTKTGEVKPQTKAFLEFILSDEGQSVVTKLKLTPIK